MNQEKTLEDVCSPIMSKLYAEAQSAAGGMPVECQEECPAECLMECPAECPAECPRVCLPKKKQLKKLIKDFPYI